MSYITKQDKVIAEAIEREFQRQNSNIELIASENFGYGSTRFSID